MDILNSVYAEYENFYNYYQNTTVSSISDAVQEITLSLSPNPVQNNLQIQATLPTSHQTFELQLMDEMGRIILQETASVFSNKWNYRRDISEFCLLYTSPSPRDATLSRMPSSA